MHCHACSGDNDDGLKFCTRCGAELATACPRCGSSNRITAMFCGHCASPLRPRGHSSVPSPPAERRQITVIFCDLVGSTALSERLDAEDWREILREYQATCATVVRRFDGHIAQYLGDGLLIYFGYPRAHEDGPRRAIQAALSIVQVMESLSRRFEATGDVKLRVRIGIHTGAVVVGEMGAAERLEVLAIGETPNLASRIQGVAEPGSVVVSDATYRLTKGYFNFRDLGARELKGFSHVTSLYEITADAGVKHRLDVAAERELTPFIGREKELAFVVARWREALEGRFPVVTVCGEPGIGKSRLVRKLREHVASEGASVVECYGSTIFQGTVLHPVLEAIEARLGFTRELSDADKLARLTAAVGPRAAEMVPPLAALLSIPVDEETHSAAPSPQKQRQATFDALVAWLEALTASQPILFIFEDLHWADPSTVEFLGLLLARTPPGPLMLLLTHRPEFVPPWNSARVDRLNVQRMSIEETLQLLTAVLSENSLPEAVKQDVLAKADGVPLYIEEIAKAVLESPLLSSAERTYDVAPSSRALAIPASVRDSLTARLDRLGPGKPVVQIGATLGRTFSFEVLQATSGMEEAALRAELGRLVTSELLFRGVHTAEETYTFKHALIQDAAYASLLRSTRQAYHRQIALVLRERFPAMSDAQPEVLAHHFSEASMAAEAIAAWALVGQRAIARSAYMEALDAFSRALRELATLPETKERDRHEIDLRGALGLVLISTRGYAATEVEANYARASSLCQQVGDLPREVLYGIWGVHLVRSDLEATGRFASLLERIADTSADPLMQILACGSLGTRAFYLAKYAEAQELCARALRYVSDADGRTGATPETGGELQAILRRLQGFEGYVYPVVYSAWCSVIQGFPEEARASLGRALDLAESSHNPYAIGLVLTFVAAVAHDSNDLEWLYEVSTRVMTLSLDNGFPIWLGTANVFLGWTEVKRGNPAGLARLEAGVGLLHNIGCFVVYPYYKTVLAEALLLCGRQDDALRAVHEALTFSEGKLASNYVPMMLKVRGDILASSGELAGAERDYRSCLATLREHGAKLFELQASIAMAGLLRRTDRVAEARSMLAAISEFFDETPALADVTAARALMTALG